MEFVYNSDMVGGPINIINKKVCEDITIDVCLLPYHAKSA